MDYSTAARLRAAIGIALAAMCGPALAVPVPIDLSTSTTVQYELGTTSAVWDISSDGSVATQLTDADASILLGNFDVANSFIAGNMTVNTAADGDFIGFVFGYGGPGDYYLFDWRQRTEFSDAEGLAEQGMSIKVVDTVSGGNPTAADLAPTAGSADVSVLRHNTVGWEDFVEYGISLNFTPGLFEIAISQGNDVLESWAVANDTFLSGAFGLYNYSQPNVVYSGFTIDSTPPPPPATPPILPTPPAINVPEPISLTLLGLGLAVLGYSRRV